MTTMRAWTTAEHNIDVGVPRGRTNGRAAAAFHPAADVDDRPMPSYVTGR
jgi:hypothetical protein